MLCLPHGLTSANDTYLLTYLLTYFGCAAPTTWNSLLPSVVNCDTLSVFKSRLKTYLFNTAYSWLTCSASAFEATALWRPHSPSLYFFATGSEGNLLGLNEGRQTCISIVFSSDLSCASASLRFCILSRESPSAVTSRRSLFISSSSSDFAARVFDNASSIPTHTSHALSLYFIINHSINRLLHQNTQHTKYT